MKRFITCLLISLLPIFFLKAQIAFQSGYYIDNQNDTIHCEIKNKGWSFIPESFTIRNIDSNETYKILTEEIKLLQISKNVKFVRILVQEDESDNNPEKIALDKNIEFTETERFLRVLVESKYSLYVAEEGSFKKFFYTDQNGIIRQLVNKRYYVDGTNVTKSQEYIKQLLRINECQESELNDLIINNKLSESNLIAYFEQINNCGNTEIVLYQDEKPTSITKLNYSLKIGLNVINAGYYLRSASSNETIIFPTTVSLAYGIELEIPIKANNYKWSLIFEPTYKKIESSVTVVDQRIDRTYNYQAQTIDIPVGIRYKFYLPNDITAFLNFKPQVTLTLGNSYVDLGFRSYDAQILFNMNAGFGLKWKKIIFEYRRDPQNLLNQRLYERLNNNSNIFIIGYTFL